MTTPSQPKPHDAATAVGSVSSASSIKGSSLSSQPVEMLLRICRQSRLGDPEGCEAVLSLLGTSKIVRAHLRKVLIHFDLNEAKLSALICLYATDPVPGTPADLAQHAKVSRPTMTTSLDSMHARGWLERHRDAADRRTCRITLTSEGRKLVEESVKPFLRAVADCADTLSAEERRTLSRTCSHLCEHFETGAA